MFVTNLLYVNGVDCSLSEQNSDDSHDTQFYIKSIAKQCHTRNAFVRKSDDDNLMALFRPPNSMPCWAAVTISEVRATSKLSATGVEMNFDL